MTSLADPSGPCLGSAIQAGPGRLSVHLEAQGPDGAGESALERFNSARLDEARRLVAPCADIAWWVGLVVGGRPYPDVDTAVRSAGVLARDWSRSDIERALAKHPRIGERPKPDSAESAMSAKEQGGVSNDPDLARRLGPVL